MIQTAAGRYGRETFDHNCCEYVREQMPIRKTASDLTSDFVMHARSISVFVSGT